MFDARFGRRGQQEPATSAVIAEPAARYIYMYGANAIDFPSCRQQDFCWRQHRLPGVRGSVTMAVVLAPFGLL
jgi:hypothetical protein